MGANVNTNIDGPIGAGGVVPVRPAAGDAWLVTDFSSDNAFLNVLHTVPDVEVSLTDDATIGIIMINPALDPPIVITLVPAVPAKRTRQLKLYVTHDLYCTITNTGAAGANIGWSAESVNVNNVRSGVIRLDGGGLGVVQPPPGETWMITEWGSDIWTVAGNINPNTAIGLTDGAFINSRIAVPTMERGQEKQPNIIINNMVYLNIIGAAAGDFYFSAIRIPETAISSITDVLGAGLTPWVDIRPPDGEEWVITEIGAETWIGLAAPDDYPNIGMTLITTAGPLESDIIEVGVSEIWDRDSLLVIDRDHYLRITDLSGANNEVCVSGYLKRAY